MTRQEMIDRAIADGLDAARKAGPWPADQVAVMVGAAMGALEKHYRMALMLEVAESMELLPPDAPVSVAIAGILAAVEEESRG